MRNLIMGILIGLAGAWLYYRQVPVTWMLWVLFILGSGLLVLALDVFFGSHEEREARAAWLGLGLLGGPGVFFLLTVFATAS